MGVKFWLQNLHAQFTERNVPVIFSSMGTTLTLQLFKNSTDTQEKLRLNLQPLSVSFRIQALVCQ